MRTAKFIPGKAVLIHGGKWKVGFDIAEPYSATMDKVGGFPQLLRRQTSLKSLTVRKISVKWSTASWLRSGLITLCVGAIAAGLAYAAGVILRIMAG